MRDFFTEEKGGLNLKKFKTTTAKEILEKELDEMPFVVEKLLPIGLGLLAGSPKVGKSYLSLWLAIKVANGENVWENEVLKSEILYLCYKDNEIRIQNQLIEITEDAPNGAHFCTEISKLGGELETRIKNFILENENTKLVIIDTLQTIRPEKTENTYANDYSDLLNLKNLAYELNICILLIHHFRKSKDKDGFNQITGSTGLQGVVDTMFTLEKVSRGEKIAKLSCIGRDIDHLTWTQ